MSTIKQAADGSWSVPAFKVARAADGSYTLPTFKLVPYAAPVSNLQAGFTVNATGLSVTLTDAAKSNSKIVSEHWDFGDGATSDTIGNQSHAYAKAGTYTISQGVTDASGATKGASQQVTVQAVQPPPPPPPGKDNIGAPDPSEMPAVIDA